jgi:hypothetical protein
VSHLANEPMYCNASGCTLHDYPVSESACDYKMALAKVGSAEARIERTVDRLVEAGRDFSSIMEILAERYGKGQASRANNVQRRQLPEEGSQERIVDGGLDIASQ